MNLSKWQLFLLKKINKHFKPTEKIGNGFEEIAHTSIEKYIDCYVISGAARVFSILSMEIKPKRIVELGTGWGIRTNLLAILNPDAKIYSIDNSTHMGQYKTGFFVLNNCKCMDIELIIGNSWELEKDNIDFCYVDTDHTYRNTVLDTNSSLKNKNTDNFVILWDDYNYESVNKAVNECMEDNTYTIYENNSQGYISSKNKRLI